MDTITLFYTCNLSPWYRTIRFLFHNENSTKRDRLCYQGSTRSLWWEPYET